MNAERRGVKRAAALIHASCTGNWSNGVGMDDFNAEVLDLSVSGAKLAITREARVGECFYASLEIPMYFIPLLAYCKVIWAGGLKQAEVGVKFMRLDAYDVRKLNDYLLTRDIKAGIFTCSRTADKESREAVANEALS